MLDDQYRLVTKTPLLFSYYIKYIMVKLFQDHQVWDAPGNFVVFRMLLYGSDSNNGMGLGVSQHKYVRSLEEGGDFKISNISNISPEINRSISRR